MQVRATLVALAAIAAAVVLGAGSASAAFPGNNGKIAFSMDIAPTGGPDPVPPDHEIFTINPDGTGLTRLTTWSGSDVSPAWNHQGTRLAFVSQNPSWRGIYTMNGDGSSVRRLTANSLDRAPVWSPDGTTIAFGRGFDLFLVNADGSGARPIVRAATNDVELYAAQPSWSPDGKTIAFTCAQTGSVWICLVDVATGKIYPVTPGIDPDWSPTGDRLVFVDYPSIQADIFTVRPNRTDRRRLTWTSRTDDQPAWSPDGTRIVFMGRAGGVATLFTMNVDGSGQHAVRGGLRMGDGMPEWQPRVRTPGLHLP